MKRLLVMLAFCSVVTASSFGAEHVVSHAVKAAGKDIYKAAKVPVKETGKVLKLVF